MPRPGVSCPTDCSFPDLRKRVDGTATQCYDFASVEFPKVRCAVDRDNFRRMADIFAALANPNRLEILSRLSGGCLCGSACRSNGGGCRCIADLAEELGIAPSTMSHHLKELRQAGLIEVERRGQRTDCCVKPGALKELAAYLGNELSP